MFKFLMMMLTVSMMFVDGDAPAGGQGGGGDGDPGEGGNGAPSGGGDNPGAGGDEPGGAPGADGQPGGNNPGGDMILGKFKDVDALTTGYSELQKKMGDFQGAPKDGYAVIEGLGETSASDNRLMAIIQEVGKDAQMGQETYEKLFTDITAMQNRVAEDGLKETIKSIPNFETRSKAMQDTALRFLRPDQAEAVDTLMQSKESFEAIEVLMGQLRGGALPQSPGGTDGISDQDLRKQINALSGSDTNERTRLLKILNERSGAEGKLV